MLLKMKSILRKVLSYGQFCAKHWKIRVCERKSTSNSIQKHSEKEEKNPKVEKLRKNRGNSDTQKEFPLFSF